MTNLTCLKDKEVKKYLNREAIKALMFGLRISQVREATDGCRTILVELQMVFEYQSVTNILNRF